MSVTPKQSFDFTSAVLNGSITFVRSTSASNPATYVGSTGVLVSATDNQPRFDFDSTTLACKGLLIEESRTNSQINSEDISGYTKTNITTSSNIYTAPDGQATGDAIVVSTVGTTQGLSFTSFIADGSSSYSASVFIRKTTGTGVSVIFVFRGSISSGTQYSQLTINTSTGFSSFVASGATSSAYTVTEINGWWRLTISAGGIPAGSMRCHVRLTSQPLNTTVGVWGCQLETGAFATSYIPTTTTALTRNADVATITGTNFSNWWQAGFGGATVQALPSTVSGTRPLIQFDDGTANEIIALRGNAANPELQIVDGGAPQVQLDAGTIVANTPYSLTGWWQTNDCKARQNSGATVSDDTATIPTVTQARLGSDGTNYLNGHLATINYYDRFSSQIYTRRKNKVIFNVI